MAKAIIDQRTAEPDFAAFADRYEDAVRDLVERKMRAKGGKISIEDEEREEVPANVVDLMAAFKKSLSASASRKPAGAARPGSRAKAARRRRA